MPDTVGTATAEQGPYEIPKARFDDLAGLETLASQGFGPWGPGLRITQEMVDAFADLSGDHQWIHVDVERAIRESPFGGPIAHGFLTLIVFVKLRAQSVEIVGHGSAINYGAERLRFLSPVPVGSTIHGRTRLLGAEPKGAGTLIKSELEVRVTDAERPAMLYSMLALYLP
jgi:acyl dehydratase